MPDREAKIKVRTFVESNLFVALIYALLVISFFNKAFIDPDWIVFGTDTIDRYSFTNFIRQTVFNAGQYPLWASIHFSGMPHVDAPHVLHTNIFCLLYYVFPLPVAFNLFMVVHFFWAGFFTFIFGREIGLSRIGAFFAGVTFMFTGTLVSHMFVGHMAKIAAWSYIPLLLFLIGRGIDKRKVLYFLIAGIVMGHQFLGGHMQMGYYSTLFIGAFAIFKIIDRRRVGEEGYKIWLIKPGSYFLLTLIIALFLYSAQLIPSYLYTQKYSERSGGTDYEFSTSWSFEPVELSGILIRDPFGYAWPNMAKAFREEPRALESFAEPHVPYWGAMPQRLTGEYFGVLPFILAIIGISFNRNRYSWFFAGSALFTLLLSMGKYTPLYWLAYKLVFGFSFFRVPLSIFALTVFALAILAGKGTDFIVNQGKEFDKKGIKTFLKILSAVTILVIVVTAILALSGENHLNLFKSNVDQYRFASQQDQYSQMLLDRFIKIRNGMYTLSLFLLLSTAILYFHRKIKKTFLVGLLLIVVLIDLLGNGSEFIVYVKIDDEGFFGKSASVKLINEEKALEKLRVLAVDDRSIPNASIQVRNFAYHGIELINGRHDLAPMYYQKMLNATMKYPKILSLLNTKYVLVTKNNDLRRFVGSGERFDKQFQLLMTDEHFKLYKNNDYIERAFIVNRVRIVSDDKYVLPYMIKDQFDPRVEAVIEEKPANPDGIVGGPASENRADIKLYLPNKVSIDASLKADGFLVLADTYYPDWKVYVDGEEGKIYKTNYALRGVYLNKGRHKVEFVYDSRILKICGAITTFTLILTLSAITWISFRERKGLSTP